MREGLVDERVIHELVLPRRRGGGPWYRCPESRFLTREELRRLLAAIPDWWRPPFDLLALTGVRISEAIGLRWCDLDLDRQVPRLHVRQAIVRGIVGARKSRHGIRSLPISSDLVQRLTEHRPKGRSALRLQHWMGHHSAAYTLESYGHLIDGGLGPRCDLTTS